MRGKRTLNIKGVLETHVQRIGAQRGEAIAAQMKPLKTLDRLVLLRIAQSEAPTGKASQRFYIEELGIERIHPNSITRSLKKLTGLDFLTRRADGSYRVADEGLWSFCGRGWGRSWGLGDI